MALRHQHEIVVRDGHGLVKRTVFGEYPLETEPLRRVQPVVIGLLQIGHVGEIILVMPVRRIRGPIAGRREHLRDQEAVGDIPLFHGDREDVAGIGILAAGIEESPPGPITAASRPGLAGAVQTASVHSVVALAVQSEPAGT